MICIRATASLLIRRASTLIATAPDTSLPFVPSADNKANLEEDNSIDTGNRQKIGRYALLLCYHGVNYCGLQFNLFAPTIENELFNALHKAGYTLGLDSKKFLFESQYTRASRTDSGVSALRQVVALKLPQTIDIKVVNQLLPSDIRILGIKRTTRGFDAQQQCAARTYSYVMPSYALCETRKLPFEKESYRMDSDTLSKGNEIFKEFEGSHRFHNYTEKRDAWDSRSQRTITSCSVSDPFLMGDLEMVQLHITGHSFMLHQIRRMIGMTIAIVVGRYPQHFLRQSLEHPCMPTPTAPALGLMLEKQHFPHYNARFGHIKEPLVWDEYDEEVELFKMGRIMPQIVQAEIEDLSMHNFLTEYLKRHCFKNRNDEKKVTVLKDWNQYTFEEIDEMLTDGNNKES